MRSCCRLIVTLIAAVLWPHASAAPVEIVYAKFSSSNDPRVSFPLAVLDLALKKMNVSYTVRPSDLQMERLRAVAELERPDRPINLIWTSMSAEVEARLRPIRIPLYRGLIGHRVFIIHKERQAEFDKVDSLDDLKGFTAGQGLGWADIKIMEEAGLRVRALKYDDLFKFVERSYLDYVPRGALEILAEIDVHRDTEPNLAAEKRLLLVYRSDLFFYLNKADEKLAATIEQGLLKAYDDGSFMRLFNSHPYIQQVRKHIGLDKRLRLEMPNPLLSDEDREIPSRFWEGR